MQLTMCKYSSVLNIYSVDSTHDISVNYFKALMDYNFHLLMREVLTINAWPLTTCLKERIKIIVQQQ